MKKLMRHTVTKTVSFVLATLFFCLTVFSVFGISLLLDRSAYQKSFEEVEAEIWQEGFSYLARSLTATFHDGNRDNVSVLVIYDALNTLCEETETAVVIRNERELIRFSNARSVSPKFQLKQTVTLIDRSDYPSYGSSYSDSSATRQELAVDGTEVQLTETTYLVTLYGYGFPTDHPTYATRTVFSLLYAVRSLLVYVFFGSLILFVLLTVHLFSVAGKHGDSDEPAPDWIDHIPFEIPLFLLLLSVPCWLLLADWASYLSELVLLLALTPVPVALFYLCGMTLATRLRCGILKETSLLYRGGRWLRRVLRDFLSHVRLVPLVAAGLGAVAVLDLLLVLVLEKLFLLVALVEGLALAALLIRYAASLCRLQKDLKQLADGRLEHRVELAALPAGLRFLGEAVNRSAEGLELAVEEKMKSERFKTELITNVSHDLKTPLTSIISFVDLMKKEKTRSKKMQEYIEVLDRQTAKLKKLTEDLVESAKATSGAIRAETEPLEVTIFLEQILGEYKGLLEEKGITPVTDLPEGPLYVLADGKLLWRIADNLMGNIAKYALPGTRAFLAVRATERQVEISFRNVSAAPLERSAEELMERFVRGDASRHSEGSGLGLAIARSLAQIQKGDMEIRVEADLFKAILTLPRA